MKLPFGLFVIVGAVFAAEVCAAQSGYQVVSATDGGSIQGTVKWQGPLPHLTPSEINKEPQICDPQGEKRRDLERLLVAQDGGIANTVVFLRDVTRGKAMDLLPARQSLNQKNCRYEPHILLVPVGGNLQVKSSDPTLHTVHMTGASDYNLPFTLQNQVINRPMTRAGVVDLRCNAGHVWMNGEMIVASHPYYTVTGQDGRFELRDVPPGDYEIVAWHEGWRVVGESPMYDVMTQLRVKRPVFSDPVIWSKHVTVPAHAAVEVNFTLGERTPQMPVGH
jgi:hypothetical protein